MSAATKKAIAEKIAFMTREKRGDAAWPRERIIAAAIHMVRSGREPPKRG